MSIVPSGSIPGHTPLSMVLSAAAYDHNLSLPTFRCVQPATSFNTAHACGVSGKQQSMTAFLRGRTAASASPQLDSASSDAADAEPAADQTRPTALPSTSGTSKRPASALGPHPQPVKGPASKRQRPLGSSQQSMRSFFSKTAPKPQGPPVPCTTSQAAAASSSVQHSAGETPVNGQSAGCEQPSCASAADQQGPQEGLQPAAMEPSADGAELTSDTASGEPGCRCLAL